MSFESGYRLSSIGEMTREIIPEEGVEAKEPIARGAIVKGYQSAIAGSSRRRARWILRRCATRC